jgi:hypothetical protein
MKKLLASTALAALALCASSPRPAAAQAANAIYELAANLANASAPIAISTATTTQLIAAPAGLSPGGAAQAIHVTHMDVVAAGTGNIQFVYGTGTNCGTGQGNLTGNYNLTAQAGLSPGSGIGVIWTVPAGNAVCAITSAAVGMAGSIAYRVF